MSRSVSDHGERTEIFLFEYFEYLGHSLGRKYREETVERLRGRSTDEPSTIVHTRRIMQPLGTFAQSAVSRLD